MDGTKMTKADRARAREKARRQAGTARRIASGLEERSPVDKDEPMAIAIRALANAVDELADVIESQEEGGA